MAKRSGLHSNPLFMPTVKPDESEEPSSCEEEGGDHALADAPAHTPTGVPAHMLDVTPADMFTSAPAHTPASPPVDLPARPPANASAYSPAPMPTSALVNMSHQPPPKISKFTFYFLPEQLQRLDAAWLQILSTHGLRFNKSEFIRLAIDRLLTDFEQDPREVIDQLRQQASREADAYPGKRKH